MADQLKKTRTELKSFFVPNAIPTADDFAAFIESGVNQLDDGVRFEAGTLTVAGALAAMAGLTVTGAPMTVGGVDDQQSLTVHGFVNASDLLTAQNGLTVSSGAVSLNAPATISGTLAVSDQVNANANLAVVGTLTAVDGPVTIGDAATNLPMVVHHSLTVNREAVLNKGLTVKGGDVGIGDSNVSQALTVSGSSNLQGGATILNGLTVSTGATTFGAAVEARAGLTVKGASVTIGESSSKQNLTVNGAITATELVSANKGLNVNNGLLFATAGMTVTNATLTVGTGGLPQNLMVYGTAQAKTFTLTAPGGDTSPVMTARVIPPGQGAANEATELILYHGDDYTGSGFGPDYITLRAPAIRLQTYGSVGTPSIDNVATSNTRINIDSFGAIDAFGKLTVYNTFAAMGLMSANAGLTVTGMATVNGAANFAQSARSNSHPGTVYGLYVTGDFADSAGVEFRHSNATQGIGFGLNTIYATGSNTDQPLRLKPRGISSVEVLGNLNISGVMSGAPNDYIKAQFTMNGGGIVTWTGGRLKWTNRFVVISAGNAASTILSGYVNVVMPTTDIPAANVYDGLPRSATTSGVFLKDWEALYAVHTPGQNPDAVTLRIVLYNVNHIVPSNWLLVAVRNHDDNSIKLGNGQTIFDGNQLNNYGPFTASGLMSANAGLTVTGATTVNGGLSIAQAARTGSHPGAATGLYVTGEFGEAAGVEFRHSNGTQGIGFGLNTIYATGTSPDQPLRLKARGASSVEVLGNLNVSGNVTGPQNDYFRAQFSLSGGGTVTWAGGRLKWTNRFLAISMGVSAATLMDGHISIYMPAGDLPAANVYDGVPRSVNANGIQLMPWDAIYAVHAMGQIADSVTFRIVRYNVPHTVPANWLLIAVLNNDDGGMIKLGTGQTIANNGSSSASGPLTVSGMLTANAGLTVAGAPVTIGTTIANQNLTVFGTSQANTYTFPELVGDRAPVITARTVPAGQGASNESTELILFHGNDTTGSASGPDYITLRAPELRLQTYSDSYVADINNVNGSNTRLAINSSGAITAFGSLTVNSTITATQLVTAQNGLSVTNGGMNVNGLLNSNSGLTVAGGALTVNNYPVNANGGLNVNGTLMINPSGGQYQLFVGGTALVNTLTFPNPPGDPSPVITARTIPAGQGNSNESTELILFHGNDPGGGSGPDYITLRAPALRFQTYSDPGVADIVNNNGSQTRVFIEPMGPVNMYHGLLRLGTMNNVTAGTVTAVVGFLGTGVQHGQLAHRAGLGFELVDCGGTGPIMNYTRDQYPYTDLRLKQLQYQTLAQFSSRTLKDDIRDLSPDEALDAFQKLNPVTYRFKADTTGRTHAGFIAEDVPTIASMDEHKAISPVDILAVLTRIVHMQQDSIRQLEQQIAALTPA